MKDKSLKNTALYESRFHFKERNSMFRYYIVLLSVFLLVLGSRLYFTTAFGGVEVDGDSMNQTLINEQRFLMRPIDERHTADYGDIIVVYTGDHPEYTPEYIIKRLIAKEGDRVYCARGQVYVQYGGVGEFIPLDEPYAHFIYDKETYSFPIREVGAGEIFFLGDNRQNSLDSEDLTTLCKEEDIYGVVPEWAVKYDRILEFLFFSPHVSAK